MTPIESAIEYAKAGFSVIAVGHDKKPLFKWEEFQNRIASEKEIKLWPKNANVGIVTGKVSNLTVVDTDTEDATKIVQQLIPENYTIPIQETPSGGRHFLFKYQAGLNNRARVTNGIDIRTEGGYIVASPSINGIGKGWNWLEGLSPLVTHAEEMPKELLTYIINSLKELNIHGTVDRTGDMSTSVYKMFELGTRDEDIFHIANQLMISRTQEWRVRQVLEILGKNCNPPFPEKEIGEKIKSVLKRAEKRERNLAEEVREWICLQGVYILSTNCLHDLHLSTREERKNLSIIFKRLCEQGVIERYGDRPGCFKVLAEELEEIDWENADDSILNIELPFDIHRWVELMPKNIIVIAGVQNAGKTCFLLNLALMNMDKFKVLYFSSEMEGPELKKRLKKFDVPLKKWRGVKFYKKEEDFAKELDPDGLNIIDFLEITDRFYLIAERLREYHKKLKKGVLFVAIQKDPHKDYGRGGNLGLEKPRLYINLDSHKLKIIKAKNWHTDFNPNGMEFKFKLIQGSKFIEIMKED